MKKLIWIFINTIFLAKFNPFTGVYTSNIPLWKGLSNLVYLQNFGLHFCAHWSSFSLFQKKIISQKSLNLLYSRVFNVKDLCKDSNQSFSM